MISAAETDGQGAPRRVAIVISSLSIGGAERAAVNLANMLAEAGFDVEIVTFEHGGQGTSLELDPRVVVWREDLARPSASTAAGAVANWRRVRALRRAFRRIAPELIVSFVHHTNVLAIFAAAALPAKVVACEESEPGRSPSGRAWRALRWLAYPLAARVVVHTRGARNWLGRLPVMRLQVIPNAVHVPVALDPVAPAGREQLVLSVGRLGREKGYDVLLQAFAEASADLQAWRLVILGEGAERHALETLARELGLDDRVSLPGVHTDPWTYYRKAAIFVSSSRHEGFGIALCEAMAAGCAAIATDCPSGPREIVEHRRNGIIVRTEDVRDLADALRELFAAPALREQLAVHGSEVAQRFHPDVIRREWLALIDDLCTDGR